MQQHANIGRLIGRYQIIEEIGRGGMAVVYRARDTRLDREVALKLLHPHLASQLESRQRFRREAQAVATLKHRSLLDVYDYSDESGDDIFIVMELIRGTTLRQLLDRAAGEPLPAEIAALILRQVGSALVVAHESGVVHRDVKPENILIGPGGAVKLSDFGIAHLAGLAQMTVTGQILGSPAYMSPEHIERAELDFRADLFSLGSVLYEASVGRVPFNGPTPHAVLKKVIECDYVDPLSLNPKIGHQVGRVIRRCLKARPEERYGSALELTGDLDAFLDAMGIVSVEEELPVYLADPEAWASARRPDFVRRTLESGLAAARKKAFPEALDHFNRVLALEPGNSRALSAVGRMRSRRRAARWMEAAAVVLPALVAIAAILWTAIGAIGRPAGARAQTGDRPAKSFGAAHALSDRPVRPDSRTARAPEPETAGRGDKLLGGTRPGVPKAKATRTVVFTPNPMAVEIVIDGKKRFQYGPASREQTLSVGKHTVTFVPADQRRFLENSWKISVPPGAEPFPFRARLDWRPADLLVKSNVEAAVTIPGRATDRANNRFPVALTGGPSETISLLVTADGYLPVTKQVTITAGELTELSVKLQKKR